MNEWQQTGAGKTRPSGRVGLAAAENRAIYQGQGNWLPPDRADTFRAPRLQVEDSCVEARERIFDDRRARDARI